MTTVYLLQAEHFEVPGRITKVFASQRAADREAAEIVKRMLADTDADEAAEGIEEYGEMPLTCDENTWLLAAEWLEKFHDLTCYVEIGEFPVITPSFLVTIAWNDNDQWEGDYSDTVEAADAEKAEETVRDMMAGDDRLKRQNCRYGRLIECREV